MTSLSPLTRFRQAALRQQLSLTMMLAVLSVALLSSLASSWQASRQIRQSMLLQGERVAATFARQGTLALLSSSPENAGEPAHAALSFPDIVRVEIHQANGKSLLAKGAPDHHPLPPLSLPLSLRSAQLEAETDESWRFIAPVIRKVETSPFELEPAHDETLGYVRIVKSKASLHRTLTQVLLINLGVSLAGAMLLLQLVRLMAGRLTKPLTELSSAMARAERGEANAQVSISGPRDIVEMAKAYNRMISVLQEREIALRDSQTRYREVIESVREVIFQLDEEARWQLLNPAWQEITGRTIDDALGQPMLDCIATEDKPQVNDYLRQLRNGQIQRATFETRFLRTDGRLAWAEVKLHGRIDPSGRFTGSSGTFDDITERKENEQALAAYQSELEDKVEARTAELQAVNKELEAFSYSISHDLRAPLRAIDGFSRLLQEDYCTGLPEEAQDYLSRIVAAADRMSQLTDGLLTLARVTRNDLNCREVDLGKLAQGLLGELQASFPERNVDIRIEPDLLAQADPAMMQAVMQNLISNAWKFTALCPIACIEVGRSQTPRGEAFFVRDNGAGFDMAYASKLFGTFQRLHGKNEYEGTGVGLATVQRIIHRHGGEIWAQAVPDHGATFFFTLPRSAA